MLRQIPFFSALSDNEIRLIESRVRLSRYPKNSVILSESETNECMYTVLEGEVKAYHQTEDGRESILAIHGPGESFGELSLIDGKTMPATVAANVDSLVACITKQDFNAMLIGNVTIMFNFLKLMCARLRESWRMQEILHMRDASARIKMMLLKLSEDHGSKVADGIIIDLHFTHQQLADMSGLTRETVTRVLDQLKRNGLLAINKEHLYILKNDFISKMLAL